MPVAEEFENLENHPACWRGNELFQRSDWLYQLNSTQLAEISAISQTANDLRIEETRATDFSTPDLASLLQRIQHSLENGSGATLIRGLPIDKFSVDQLKKVFWIIASQIGTPVSQSAAGERIFSVRNEGFSESDPRARGPNSKKKLSFHTDRCDVIGFLCVRQAKFGGENSIVSALTLYNKIRADRPDLLKVLMEPFYYKRHNVDAGNTKPFIEQPIFSIFEGHFAANILRVLIDRAYQMPELPDMTDIQREALDFVEKMASDPDLHVSFRQEPGDMLFLNNFTIFHRRQEFEDFEEPELRRHLLRIWLSVPNSRPLDPMFAGNYGNTEAGALRGGMNPVA